MSYRKGARVRHPQKPDWGLGQVLEDSSDEVRVFFVGVGEKRLSTNLFKLERITGKAAHSELLDNLKIKKGSEPIRFKSMSESVQFFLREFPGGFAGERLHEEERDYKVKARDLARELLDEGVLRGLLADGRHGEVCDRAMRVTNATNLIFPNEKMQLKDGLKAAAVKPLFAKSLVALLYGSGEEEARFTRFADVLERMHAAKWTTATYFPFLIYPDRHIFLKPTVTQHAADLCGFEISYDSHLNWKTYSRVQAFARWLFNQLTEAGLPPTDMIDVQTFIWCIAPGKY